MSKVYGLLRMSNVEIKVLYEGCCEEYRRRLCEMWGIPFDESWWFADKIGEGLFLCDCSIPLDMPMLRYVVENNIAESDWIGWCDFVDSEIFAGRNIPRINFRSWMMGLRPEMLKDDDT